MSILAHKRYLSEMTPLTFYEGIKEAFSISRNELYLWDSDQDEYECWKIFDAAGHEGLLNEYLHGKAELLDLYNLCKIRTAKIFYSDENLELIVEEGLFTPTSPKAGARLFIPFYSDQTKTNAYVYQLEDNASYTEGSFIRIIKKSCTEYRQKIQNFVESSPVLPLQFTISGVVYE